MINPKLVSPKSFETYAAIAISLLNDLCDPDSGMNFEKVHQIFSDNFPKMEVMGMAMTHLKGEIGTNKSVLGLPVETQAIENLLLVLKDRLTDLQLMEGVYTYMEGINPNHEVSHITCDWVGENFRDYVVGRHPHISAQKAIEFWIKKHI